MLIRFVLAAPASHDGSDERLTFFSLSTTSLHLQRLWSFCAYLGDSRETSGPYPGGDFRLKQLLTDLFVGRTIYNTFGQPFEFDRHQPEALFLKKISYASPLEIEATSHSERLEIGRVQRVLRTLRQIVTLEAVQEKAHWEAEIARQRAIEAALKNSERLLEVSKKIKDPELREQFIRNFAKAICALTAEAAPRLKEVHLADHKDEEAFTEQTA